MAAIKNSPVNRSVSAFLIVCLVVLNLPVTAAAGGGTPAEDLKKIQYEYYYRGKYSEAIDALRTFLARTDVRGEVAVSAREFLAASYVLSGDPDKGKDQFLHLLNENEEYTGPDPAMFKPEVVEAFTTTRDTLLAVKLRTAPETDGDGGDPAAVPVGSTRPIYKKWWFYVGLAAVAVVVAAAVAPEEDDTPAPAEPTGTVTVGVRIQ